MMLVDSSVLPLCCLCVVSVLPLCCLCVVSVLSLCCLCVVCCSLCDTYDLPHGVTFEPLPVYIRCPIPVLFLSYFCPIPVLFPSYSCPVPVLLLSSCYLTASFLLLSAIQPALGQADGGKMTL